MGLHAPGTEAPKLRLTAGKVVPGTRYRILRWLGEGGMGVVYEAEHVDIERKVALKILRFDLSQQPRMVQVFRDEAKAASRLGSDYLVEIYDFGELPDGRLFFAMELLDGEDLVPAETGNAIGVPRLIATLRQVCKGLAVAHEAGVVHRDVKPENIITTSGGSRKNTVKIVDFGISAMLAAGPGHKGGGIAGTPHYMAPEQILGKDFDGRLDIYALGCTAYELLVGAPPFDADSVEDLLHKQLAEPPLAPRTVRPELKIPAELEGVILRCLAKEPQDRFADMADLEAAICEAQIAADVRTEFDHLPIPEVPDAERRARIAKLMPSPVPKVHKRAWLWPTVAGASTLAATALGLFLAFGQEPTERDRGVVEQLTAEAREAAAKRNWVAPPPGQPDAHTAIIKVEEIDALEGPAEALADQRSNELRDEFASTLNAHGDELWDAGAKQIARKYYQWALVFEDNDDAFARSGMDYDQLNDFRRRVSQRDWTDIDQLNRLLAIAAIEEEPDKQKEILDRAAAFDEEQGLDNRERILSVAKRKEVALKRRRDKQPDPPPALPPVETADPNATPVPDPAAEAAAAEEAARAGAKARRRQRRSHDPRALLGKAERNPAKAKQLAQQGRTALRAGKRSEAAKLFNQAIAYNRKNAVALMGLSDIYFDTGQDQKAVVYAERAVAASPSNKAYRLKLGDAYFKVLRYKDAQEQYRRAKKLGSSRADARLAKVNARLGG